MRMTVVLLNAVSLVFVLAAPAGATPSEAERLEYVVPITTPEDVDRITDAGVIVGVLRADHAIAYVQPADMERLRAMGFEPERVRTLSPATPTGYPSYADITARLQTWAAEYPDIAWLTSLGPSVEGRQLWALRITTEPESRSDKPAFKYVSTMHGDEPLGTVLCMRLIERLLTDYDTDPRITDLVEATDIWIVPLMNPEGYEGQSRFNANGVDLNRDFPVYPPDFVGTVFDGAPLGDENRQPETAHIMRWTIDNAFVLSANLHTGSLVVNYPYDDDGGPSGVEQPTPDDALFRELALRYARNNPPLYASAEFPQGITNGAAWYVIRGGMQDWNYRYAGCKEITFELSYVKVPPAEQFDALWLDNEEALLQYIEAVHMGVRGMVTDAQTGAPVNARIRVEGNPQPVFTDPRVGHFHRLLLPGVYTIIVDGPGYAVLTLENVEVTDGPATVIDVALEGAERPRPSCPFALTLKAHPEALAVLRGFRDTRLEPDPLGAMLVQGYYRMAPALAQALENRQTAQHLVRATGAMLAGRLAHEADSETTAP